MGSGWLSLLSSAAEVIKCWHDEEKAREAIAAVFRQGFLAETGGTPHLRLRPDVVGKKIDLAKLRFHFSGGSRDTLAQDFYEVTVTRLDLPGGDPKGVRLFRYMTGKRLEPSPGFHMVPGIWWPPFNLGNVRYFMDD